MIWVFHVSIDPTPKLHLLMHYELPALSWCQKASTVEDTFVMLWRTYGSEALTLTVVAVNFSSLSPSRNGCPLMERYSLRPIVSCI
jgi:hypothetical protein